jgi:hypothetical protein
MSTVRDCSSSGQHGLGYAFHHGALRIGPLSLGDLGDPGAITAVAPLVGSRFPALESIAVLQAGHEATVMVPQRERATVALLYDKSRFRDDGLYSLRGMASTVAFKACGDPSFNHGVSQFDGGLLVTRPQCLELDFTFDGSSRMVRRYVPFRRSCAQARRQAAPSAAAINAPHSSLRRNTLSVSRTDHASSAIKKGASVNAITSA